MEFATHAVSYMVCLNLALYRKTGRKEQQNLQKRFGKNSAVVPTSLVFSHLKV